MTAVLGRRGGGTTTAWWRSRRRLGEDRKRCRREKTNQEAGIDG
jgi:hypothetical protein